MAAFARELSIRNDLAYLAVVRDAVGAAVIASGFPITTINRLQIAVDEAVTNIIEHGYRGRPSGSASIKLRLEVGPERFLIEIADEGAVFDPRGSADVDIAAHAATGNSGGLGVFLMRRIMDVVDYHAEAGRKNCLVLIKYR